MMQQTRFAWYLLAPAAILLIVLLVLPIVIMAIYTFYEFVTAGVEKATYTLANWQEFFGDSYYHQIGRAHV